LHSKQPPPARGDRLALHDALPIWLPPGLSFARLETGARVGARARKPPIETFAISMVRSRLPGPPFSPAGIRLPAGWVRKGLCCGDRKSTRLNSSYGAISYAGPRLE